MMEDEQLTESNGRSLGTVSYPTKVAGDMLWAFLDPTVPRDDGVPDLPPHAAIPERELRDKFWVHNFLVSPVSYESQIENSIGSFSRALRARGRGGIASRRLWGGVFSR